MFDYNDPHITAGLGLDCRRKMGSGQAALCPVGTPEQERGASRILQPLFSPQVEMFLLAYAVRHTIQVYRLSKYGTEEFVTVYPTDAPRDWPVVTLIAEDDRHYNVPVRVCEETSL